MAVKKGAPAQLLPDGVYECLVTAVNEKEFQTGNKGYTMELTWLVGGHKTNRRFWQPFTDVPQAAWAWQRFVDDIHEMPQLVGNVYMVHISVDNYDGNLVNRVAGFCGQVLP